MSDGEYKPGDIANGHILGADNQWHPLDENIAPPTPPVVPPPPPAPSAHQPTPNQTLLAQPVDETSFTPSAQQPASDNKSSDIFVGLGVHQSAQLAFKNSLMPHFYDVATKQEYRSTQPPPDFIVTHQIIEDNRANLYGSPNGYVPPEQPISQPDPYGAYPNAYANAPSYASPQQYGQPQYPQANMYGAEGFTIDSSSQNFAGSKDPHRLDRKGYDFAGVGFVGLILCMVIVAVLRSVAGWDISDSMFIPVPFIAFGLTLTGFIMSLVAHSQASRLGIKLSSKYLIVIIIYTILTLSVTITAIGNASSDAKNVDIYTTTSEMSCDIAKEDAIKLSKEGNKMGQGEILDITGISEVSSSGLEKKNNGTLKAPAVGKTVDLVVCSGTAEFSDLSSGVIKFGYYENSNGNLFTFYRPATSVTDTPQSA